MKAKYSSVQKAHFGLSTEYYCHFTSPIRRYPDLSVHRIIKAMLNGEINDATIGEYEGFAENSAVNSSENEMNAVHAERDIDDLYKCVYMQDKIGEEYEAVICSVTSFGFFAKTENLCEGLVPIEQLGNSFFFDKANYTLASGKTVYRLGQRVKIRVDDVDITARRINFVLIKEKPEGKDEQRVSYPSQSSKSSHNGSRSSHRSEKSRKSGYGGKKQRKHSKKKRY